MHKKVVVTGMGAITPIGNSVAEFCESLKTGKSGIPPITLFDTKNFDVTIAGEVKNFDPSNWIEKKEARKMSRFIQFAVAATVEALNEAKLLGEPDADGRKKVNCDPERIGVVIGNGMGGFDVVSESYKKLFESGPKRM